jgi:glutaminyl-peptide cyclotransferase
MMASRPWKRNIIFLLVSAFITLEVNAYTSLSDDSLKKLPAGGADFDIHNGPILSPILIPRVAGTEGSKKVQNHIVNWFATNLPNWKVEYQNSTSKTPVSGGKDVPFVNLIMTRDPPWAMPGEVGRLNLVAHYDSKLTPKDFIGATDSAAPVAIIMHAARSVEKALSRKWDAMKAAGAGDGLDEEVGLQILFLDGEEAFVNWTDDDSLYGARYEYLEWMQRLF